MQKTGEFMGENKPVSGRRFLGYTTAGLRTIVSTLVRRPIRVWLAGAMVIVIVAAGFLMVLSMAPASAATEEEAPLDCLSCHTRVLESHDKLGEGSKACWVCHDSLNIGILRLADGTQLSLADSSQLCGQCHQGRYGAWNEGTHGVLAWQEGEPGIPNAEKPKCISCHNPHQPRIALTDITRPPQVSVAPGEEAPLECLSCHVRVLKGHDKLGEGNKACWSCHSNTQMGVLHLAGGETLLPLSDSPQLCAQCHQKRYEDWTEGTHGMPSWKEGAVEVHGVQQVGCISCHDPHQPQIALLNITKPHPPPTPPPPSPPFELLIMLGIALVPMIAVGVAVVRGGERP